MKDSAGIILETGQYVYIKHNSDVARALHILYIGIINSVLESGPYPKVMIKVYRKDHSLTPPLSFYPENLRVLKKEEAVMELLKL
jgi:hypothetical protein